MFVLAANYHLTQTHIPINYVQKVCKGESILAMNSPIQPVTSSCLILNFASPIIKSTILALCMPVMASKYKSLNGILSITDLSTQYPRGVDFPRSLIWLLGNFCLL